MKEYRRLLQFGTFYRILSPFEGNVTCWMCVSDDKKQAIAGWYRVLNGANLPFSRIRLQGLNPDFCYKEQASGASYYGDELMNLGLITTDGMSGQPEDIHAKYCDFDSRLYVLTAE